MEKSQKVADKGHCQKGNSPEPKWRSQNAQKKGVRFKNAPFLVK